MKAVLVFCEGRHDVVFTQRSLGAVARCEWVDEPIRELPSPFGAGPTTSRGLIATRIGRHAIEESTVRAAAHPSSPCFESVVKDPASDTMYFLVRIQGARSGDVVSLLDHLDLAITDEVPGTYDVSEYAAVFLFDANDAGVTEKLREFRARYEGHFGNLSTLEHGAWVSTPRVPVGCFVFREGVGNETGTLDDHLAPMAQSAWPDRYAGAEDFIDGSKDAHDKVSMGRAERLKAIITVAGQFNQPGDPLSEIIGRHGLPRQQFARSPLSQALGAFLTTTPWRVD